VSSYTVYINSEAFDSIKELPGNMRQRIRRSIKELAENPRPSDSKMLDLPEFEVTVWRQRVDNWRIIYIINEAEKIVDVLAIRKRPPYDYGDLQQLLENL
jgi:mRNA interferase RelE/StbE